MRKSLCFLFLVIAVANANNNEILSDFLVENIPKFTKLINFAVENLPRISKIIDSTFAKVPRFNKLSDFVVQDKNGRDFNFNRLKDKCVLIVDAEIGSHGEKENMELLNSLTELYPSLEIFAFPPILENENLDEWFFEDWKAKYNVMGNVDFTESDLFKFLNNRANEQYTFHFDKYVIEKDGITVRKFDYTLLDIDDLHKHITKCINTAEI